jgi:hypothetical protein
LGKFGPGAKDRTARDYSVKNIAIKGIGADENEVKVSKADLMALSIGLGNGRFRARYLYRNFLSDAQRLDMERAVADKSLDPDATEAVYGKPKENVIRSFIGEHLTEGDLALANGYGELKDTVWEMRTLGRRRVTFQYC